MNNHGHAMEPHETARLSAAEEALATQADNFSLVLGGPLYQLLRRAHLSDDALEHVKQRILVIAALAWVPLLLLSAVEGRLLPGSATVPFLYDLEVHIRFLVALPLLVLAELVVHQRMRRIALAFLERGLIPASHRLQFLATVDRALRLRNSVTAELVLILLVYGVGVLIVWRHFVALDASSWYAVPVPGGTSLTPAGIWYAYLSVPMFQFLLLRWYFRIFIWARLLWGVSRLPLNLVPTHPDRVGGLGFLSGTVFAFTVLVVAHGALLAANLSSRIFFAGESLLDFKAEIGLMATYLALLVFGPLLVFAPQLAAARREGLREYGILAGRYVREFDAKWVRGGAPPDEPFVGSGDIQSLADLGNSYQVVKEMRSVPITRDAIFQLAAALLLPVAPLALTIMPLEDLLKKLAGLLL